MAPDNLENLPEVLSFALHWVVNPLITVAGDEARARWYLIEPCTGARSGRALWGAGHYDDRLVREGGVWKFREVVLQQIFWTPFDAGWAKKRGVASASRGNPGMRSTATSTAPPVSCGRADRAGRDHSRAGWPGGRPLERPS